MRDATPSEYSAVKAKILAVLDPALKGAKVEPADVIRLVTHPSDPIVVRRVLEEIGEEHPKIMKFLTEE